MKATVLNPSRKKRKPATRKKAVKRSATKKPVKRKSTRKNPLTGTMKKSHVFISQLIAGIESGYSTVTFTKNDLKILRYILKNI